LSQCKYCYKDFDCETKVQSHEDTEHFKRGYDNLCQICNNCYPTRNNLIQHMMKVHVKSEMPYQCQVCGHRSSHHHEIVEHFQTYHDRTDKLQCPHCLKTYSMYNDKGYNSTSSSSYLQHMQRHEDVKKRANLQCKKCCLRFIEDRHLKNHILEDHLSFKDFDNIEPYQYVATDEPIQMPKPDERFIKTAVKKSSAIKSLPQQAAFAAQNLEDLAIYDVQGDVCCECGRSMTSPGHYVAYLCCTKCRYSTCCAKTMAGHVQLFHTGSKTFDLGKSSIIREPMYCVCGYSAHSGNKLAKHLGTHGCKSAYPTIQEANKARVDVEGSENTNNAVNTNEDNVRDEPEKNDTASENMDTEDEKESKEADTNSNELSENENSEAETEKKDAEAKTDDEKEQEEDDKPGPGGILFGTFFNNMEKSKTNDDEEDTGTSKIDDETERKDEETKDNDNEKDDTDKEKEVEDDGKTTDEDDKQPGPGGILFGTFFNNMEKSKNADEDKEAESEKNQDDKSGSKKDGDEGEKAAENMEVE